MGFYKFQDRTSGSQGVSGAFQGVSGGFKDAKECSSGLEGVSEAF